MPLNFPNSPTNGQTYTYGGVTYFYDSSNISWLTTFVAPPSLDLVSANNWANTKLSNTSGVSFSGNLFFPNGNVSINTTSANLRLEVGGNMSVDAFIENSVNIATSYTITTGRNALSAGPITINSGVTVTVPSGSTWTVV